VDISLSCCFCCQERQRLIDKFGPSPFSDKADSVALLRQFHDVEAARMVRAQPPYVDDDDGAKKDSSSDGATADVDADAATDAGDCSLNYARKAIREITAIGRLRLEERKSAETLQDDGSVQDSDVSSTTTSTTDDSGAQETLGEDSAAENTSSSSSSSSAVINGQVSLSSAGDPNLSLSAAEKHLSTANDVDGIAICLT